MTDLDKKHNVLRWIPEKSYSVIYKAAYAEYAFRITFTYQSDRVSLTILRRDNGKVIKISSPQTVDIAKAQAELFILNLKR